MKCKSCFYHIPDPVPIKNFFQGLKEAWFLRLDATCIVHVQNHVVPMTDSIITKQGNNPGKPCLANARGIQQYVQQATLVEGECLNLTQNSPSLIDHHERNIIPNSVFRKSRETNSMPLPQDGNGEYSLGKLSGSTSNVNSVTDHVTFEGKRDANDNAKRQSEQSIYPQYQPEELPTSMHGPKRKGRLKKKCNSKDVVGGSLKDVKMKIHSSLGGYPNDENLLFDNSCREQASEETQQRQVDSHDGEHGRSVTPRRKFKKKANSCKDIQSRCKMAFTEEGSKDGHFNKGLESNATDASVEGRKLVSHENSFPRITQKDQCASFSREAQVDCLGSVNEAVGGEDLTASLSNIISVTGIITTYFFESDEVNSQSKSLRNATECTNQTNDSDMQKLVNECHPFIASNVKECKSKSATSKKFKKHKKHQILPSGGKGVAGLDEKGRNTAIHDTTDEHRVNQGHQDLSINAAVNSPPIQFSVQWSDSRITETPRSKPEVGKRVLLAANGLGISASKQKSQIKCCSRITKLPKSFALARNVFHISNFDD